MAFQQIHHLLQHTFKEGWNGKMIHRDQGKRNRKISISLQREGRSFTLSVCLVSKDVKDRFRDSEYLDLWCDHDELLLNKERIAKWLIDQTGKRQNRAERDVMHALINKHYRGIK